MAGSGLCLLLVTRNESEKAAGLLWDLVDVVDEVVLVDSSDELNIKALEKPLNAVGHTHVLRLPPLGLAELYRPYALSKACSEWVLLLDSDERINDALKRDIRRIITEGSADAFMIQRQPVDESRGESPSESRGMPWPKTRLFRRSKAQFFGLVHEQPSIAGTTNYLPPKYKMIHYVNSAAYWSKARRYIKLDVFLGRWRYNRFGRGSILKRWGISAYVRLRGKTLLDEVSPFDLYLIKRLAAKGLKKLSYQPNEYLTRKVSLISHLSPRIKKFSFDVWSDIQPFRGAIPYLGLTSEFVWNNLWECYRAKKLPPDDFFLYKVMEKFFERNPTYSLDVNPIEVLREVNAAADRVFPETLSKASPTNVFSKTGGATIVEGE